MIKEALIKALAPISLMVLFLIVGLAPLYLLAGLMTRSFSITTPQTEYRPVKR
jgi:hypothetical protein